MLGAARCCSILFDRNKNIPFVSGFYLTPKFRIFCYVCTDFMRYSAGAHETLEMLDEMLDSFDRPEQSSTEQSRAKASKVVHCFVKCLIRLKGQGEVYQGKPLTHSKILTLRQATSHGRHLYDYP